METATVRVQQEIAEEGRRTYRPKRCEYNNKDEDNSPRTLNDKNHQASSLKFQSTDSDLYFLFNSVHDDIDTSI